MKKKTNMLNRSEVFLKMKETGVVPVFYHSDTGKCKKVMKICFSGGIRLFEFVNRGNHAHEVFRELFRWKQNELPEMILGAGSIVDPVTAGLYIQLGAGFIVSPNFNEKVARICNRRMISYCPGCGTVTEISKAQEMGSELVKIFPASELGGPSFVKAVRCPMPWTNIMPTGGVDITEHNLRKWFEAGITCVGIDSGLFPEDMIEKSDWKGLSARVQTLMNNLKAARADNRV